MEKLKPKAPVICFIILALVLLALYFPLAMMFLGSFIKAGEWTLAWYNDVFLDAVLGEALLRSLIIAILNGFVATIMGTLVAISVQRTGFKFKRLTEFFSLLSLVVPELVFALSLLSWFFILKFELSLITVMIAHVTFSISFVVFTVNARLNQMDFSLDEAAEDLGALPWQVLYKVTLPLLKPALGAAFLLSFLLSFDDFLITFFTSGVGSDTLPVKLYTAMRMGSSPKLNALACLMIFFSSGILFVMTKFVRKLQA